MNKIKTIILDFLLGGNLDTKKEYYRQYLESLYSKNKDFFEELLVRDFIGYIPKDVNEPALKIFEEHAELFQRWILWQSYYLNRKSIHDPLRITKYDGMMIYLKVLHVMAEANKKRMTVQKTTVSKVEIPWLDQVMGDLQDINQKYADKTNEANYVESSEDGKGGKAHRTKGKGSEDA